MAKRIEVKGLEFYLLPQKALYIPKYKMLVISDWHLGKLSHFRKEGLFVPSPAIEEELERLTLLIKELNIVEVVFLGDLFHSDWNPDWDKFKSFISSQPSNIKFILTKGNHDILKNEHFANFPLIVKEYYILEEGVVLSHEPLKLEDNFLFNIVGHIHPGYSIELKGRQSIRVACFHLQDRMLTMPAFGKFTGLFIVKKENNNKIYGILNDTILDI